MNEIINNVVFENLTTIPMLKDRVDIFHVGRMVGRMEKQLEVELEMEVGEEDDEEARTLIIEIEERR